MSTTAIKLYTNSNRDEIVKKKMILPAENDVVTNF